MYAVSNFTMFNGSEFTLQSEVSVPCPKGDRLPDTLMVLLDTREYPMATVSFAWSAK